MTERLRVENLSVWFPLRGGVLGRVQDHVQAVRKVDLRLASGEILAVVGESGCGKSTLASALVGLVPWRPNGRYWLDGEPLDTQKASAFDAVRDKVQLVFQDPFSSLNPRQTVQEILTWPLLCRGESRSRAMDRMKSVLDLVGLSALDAGRFPHAFSGGQRQRIGIARALMLDPRVLLCDEITSALDVSVQAQILALVDSLRKELGISVCFISHDLGVVRALADRVMVMYRGLAVEEGEASSVLQAPWHPYTRALLNSVPTLDRSRRPSVLPPALQETRDLLTGCPFRIRCTYAQPECAAAPLWDVSGSRRVRCLHPLDRDVHGA